jgi:hypothetical protein
MIKRIVVYGALFAAIILLLGLANRRLLERKLWHWTHRSTLAIGEYRVKVPPTWIAKPFGDRGAIVADTQPTKVPGRLQGPIVIFTLGDPLTSSPDDIKPGEQTELIPMGRSAGEHFACFRHKESSRQVPPGFPSISWGCFSQGGLRVDLTGMPEDEQSLRQILDNVQKTR